MVTTHGAPDTEPDASPRTAPDTERGSQPDTAPDTVSDTERGTEPGTVSPGIARLAELAGSVPDPELPVVTLGELGVVRAVIEPEPGHVEVELTPTYTGCPAIEAMAADVERAVRAGGAERVTVRTVLTPPWSTDDISPEGRRKLKEHGVAPPRHSSAGDAPVLVGLSPTRRTDPGHAPELAREFPRGQGAREFARARGQSAPEFARGREAEPVRCPQCGSADTTLLARFSSTACKALRRCEFCREPFDHFKEV